MGILGWMLLMIALSFGLGAYDRVSKLEKKLKEKGILDSDWKSE